jgi:serine/threonine protein kinase
MSDPIDVSQPNQSSTTNSGMTSADEVDSKAKNPNPSIPDPPADNHSGLSSNTKMNPETDQTDYTGKSNESLPSEAHNFFGTITVPQNYDPSRISTPSGVFKQLERPTDLPGYLRTQGYELLEELGRGGMGVVYKAKQLGLNRLCALKLINPEKLDNSNLKGRFSREVQAAAKLSHPNIVTVFHTTLDGPVLFLAMEYVPGVSLSQVVKSQGPLPHEIVLKYMRQAAEGLQHAHEQGMVHRDIKPSNLMITPWPNPSGKKVSVKILDMGLARSIDSEESDMGLTQAGELLGTPDFMSPEQAEDPRLVDIRSDLYSLGGTMFMLLTGRMLFQATTLVQKLKKHLLEVPPLVHTIRPEVHPGVSAIVAKLLAKAPGDRYQTPQELIDTIDSMIHGRSSPLLITPHHPTAAPTAPISFSGHQGHVYSLAISKEGKYLLSGGSDETIHLWEIASRRTLRTFANKGGAITAVGLSPDGRFAVTSAARLFDDANQIDLWEVSSGKFLGKLKGMKTPIQCLAFSSDSRKLAAGSEDGAVCVWSLDGKTPTLRLPGHKTNVTAIAFMNSEDRLLTACRDGTLALWELSPANLRGTMQGTVGPIRSMAIAGNRVALAGDQLRLRHGDGSFVSFVGYRGIMNSVVFSPGRRHLLAGGADGTPRLWAIENASPIEEFPVHQGKIHTLVFAPDGKSIFSAGEDGIIRQCFPVTPGLS